MASNRSMDWTLQSTSYTPSYRLTKLAVKSKKKKKEQKASTCGQFYSGRAGFPPRQSACCCERSESYRAPKILGRNSQGSSLRKKKWIVKVSFVGAAAALLIIKSVLFFLFFSILWRLLGSRDLYSLFRWRPQMETV